MTRGSLTILPMEESCARSILRWRYDGPYSRYNLGEEDLDELLCGCYFAVFDSAGALVGFFCFGTSAQVPAGLACGAYGEAELLDIGLGMDPALCGRGMGLAFLRQGMEWAAERFQPRGFRLTVAAFNQRAIAVYERAGYQKATLFVSAAGGRETEFWVMNCRPRQAQTEASASYTATPTSPGPE